MSISAANDRAWKIVSSALALVVLAIAASVAGALVPRASIDPLQTRLEAAGDQGIDPFTSDLRLVQEQGIVPSDPRSNQELDGRAAGTTEEASGACDVDALGADLESDSDKSAVWRAVFGVDDRELAEFISRLAPASLSQDTVVMNHGYRNGVAQPVRTILQAGTLVLVDGFGVPRVLCKCGNPLLTTTSVGMEMPQGEPWPNFDSKQVVSLVAVDQPTVTPVPPTAIPLPTVTPPPAATPTAEPLSTATPSATPLPTATPVPPQAPPPPTATPVPPTPTSVPPTATAAPEIPVVRCTVNPSTVSVETEVTVTIEWTQPDTVLNVVVDAEGTNIVNRGSTSPVVVFHTFARQPTANSVQYLVNGGNGLVVNSQPKTCFINPVGIIGGGCRTGQALPNGECCPDGLRPLTLSDGRVICGDV